MATCLLVYVPSSQFRIEECLPREELALAAGYLRHAGHTVRIVDLATPALCCGGAAGLMRRPAGWRLFRRAARATDPQRDRLVSRLTEALYSVSGGLDLVAFLVRGRDGLAMSTKIGLALQDTLAETRTVCFGDYAARFAAYICAYNPFFDTVVAEEPGTVLSCLMSDPDLVFAGVPGLMVREREGSHFTGRIHRANHDAPRPLPDYTEGTYPQVHTGEKLRYFTVRQYGPQDKTAPSVMARARHVREQFGRVPLHFEYSSAQPAQLESLAHGLRAFDIDGPCTLDAPVGALAGLAPEAIRAMECVAGSVRLHSGSQRALDEYFNAGFTITEAECALRGLRAGGASAHVALTSPCPWDDEHTDEETLRILSRNRPESTTLSAPEPAPGMPWFSNPERYGFRMRHRLFARHLAAADAAPAECAVAPLAERVRALGLAVGPDAHDLACAALSAGSDAALRHAEALHALFAGHDDAMAEQISAINAAVGTSQAVVPGNLGRLRAAMGN